MTTDLRGWIDYDRHALPSLGPGERLDYFEKRVHLVAINPLRRLLSTEIQPAPDSSALLIFGVALCCAIEATGKFVIGGRGNKRQCFEAFLTRYMSPEFNSQTVGTLTFGKTLWKHFRNGLAHGFVVCHGGFEGNPGDGYFAVRTIAGTPSLMVNPSSLYDDFVDGFSRYLSDLRGCQPLGQLFLDFNTVFEAVFIRGE